MPKKRPSSSRARAGGSAGAADARARGPAASSDKLAAKLARLKKIVARCGGALVAFSGGVDSTFLLSVARDVLGAKLLAVTVAFPAVPAAEVRAAKALARSLKVRHLIINADDVIGMEPFHANPPDRCYYCKTAILSKLLAVAQALGFPCILEASNKDDVKDYRPGHKAVKELGAKSPLIEAGLTKADIRALSKRRGLPTWNKPSAACLASRIPYGETITREKLGRIEKGEAYLAGLGFGAVRLRHHGALARIEVPGSEIPRLLRGGVRSKVVAKMKSLGFRYITFDLEGYRSGSMNEALPAKRKLS
jgi:uncharacterized protein